MLEVYRDERTAPMARLIVFRPRGGLRDGDGRVVTGRVRDGAQHSAVFDQEHGEELWIGGDEQSLLLVRDPNHGSSEQRRLSQLPAGHAQGYAQCFENFVSDTYAAIDGATPEGLPTLMLSNMPIQSTVPSIQVTRPEIYFGELTNTDVYVKTRQKEFDYPQGESNSMTSYQGNGGIVLGSFPRRLLIAFDRGDIAKVPFSDDINAESRLLMRRSVFDRVKTLAPFLTFENDPYIVIGEDGRLSWILDAFTTSDRYPYSSHYDVGNGELNYLRNSVKIVIDAYNGATTFYVFDPQDPIINAYRRIFPQLFKDAADMPQDLRKHVRYPELLLRMQAAAYGLYHMTNPGVFYNREDLWTVASEVGMSNSGGQAAQPMDPNFVLMKLPGQSNVEFVEILPFTPSNRNNMIGWIAGRSDGDQYGKSVVYDFPKTRLVDGPLQVEARIDQNAQLSGQLSLWNQQGSRVRRGSLLVIPCGKALIYAEAGVKEYWIVCPVEKRVEVFWQPTVKGYAETYAVDGSSVLTRRETRQ